MLTVDLISSTASGVAGRSEGSHHANNSYVYLIFTDGLSICEKLLPTCLQVPQVFAAHLVVPALSVPIAAAPDINSGPNSDSAVAGPGSGTGGIWVFALGPLAVQLGFNILVLLWAKIVPAHSVCDRKTLT